MNLEEAKRRILARESYNDVAHRLGVPSLKLYNLLANDPDIVAAKAAGKLNSSKRYGAHHFSNLPHVVDVLRNGLSQTEAAKKHGKFPSQVSRDVKKAMDEQGAAGAAPVEATQQAPQSETPQQAALHQAVKDATAAGQTKEQILTTVLGAL
jgi:hypothetical protein